MPRPCDSLQCNAIAQTISLLRGASSIGDHKTSHFCAEDWRRACTKSLTVTAFATHLSQGALATQRLNVHQLECFAGFFGASLHSSPSACRQSSQRTYQHTPKHKLSHQDAQNPSPTCTKSLTLMHISTHPDAPKLLILKTFFRP